MDGFSIFLPTARALVDGLFDFLPVAGVPPFVDAGEATASSRAPVGQDGREIASHSRKLPTGNLKTGIRHFRGTALFKILTLFLGLYTGAQTVELEVGDGLADGVAGDRVAEIEPLLDGESAGTVSQPPWKARVDLGPQLVPRELIAVARDADGDELARARRWINLQIEPPADDDGTDRDATTAVVVRLDPGVDLPAPQAMRGWFTAAGEPLDVLRVERGDAEVVIVRDPMVQPHLDRTARFFFLRELQRSQEWDPAVLSDQQAFIAYSQTALQKPGDLLSPQRAEKVWSWWNAAFSFGDDAGVRFISPRAAPVSRVARAHRIFNVTLERRSIDNGLLWHSAAVRPLYFEPRLADAVAMAGLETHAGRRRRAVVLMLERRSTAASRYPLRAVRDYLEAVQVPLFVWRFSVEEPGAPAADAEIESDPEWGPARDLSHAQKLSPDDVARWLNGIERAVAGVRDELARQRVVWLAGEHAPNRVELSMRATGVRLAGSTAPVPIPVPAAGAEEADG